MSACVVLAWCILPLAAMVGPRTPGPAQANISTAASISTASTTSTPVILTSESVTAKTAEVTAHRAGRAATWTVLPGDTLSAIASGLRVPGGWQALYAANRSAVGANPNAIRPGIILATPRQATRGQASRAPAPASAQPRHQASRAPDQLSHQASPAPAQPRHQASPAPAQPRHQASPVRARSSHLTAPVTGIAAGGMPRWLEDLLLAAGVLAATAFAAEPAAALARRRKVAGQTGYVRPVRPARHRAYRGTRDLAKQAAEKAKIILADHERLIVTYSVRDHTVYVLTPPGEDPMVVLSAARLVLPEDTYKDLAGHLGVPSAWPSE